MTWQASVFPEARDRLRELEAELWAPGRMDPVILELCRLRLAQLLGDRLGVDQRTPAAVEAGLTDEDVAELAHWPTSGRVDARTRACLAFTELYVIDAHAVTDKVCGELRAELSDGEAVALTMALATFDATSRLRVVFA